MSGHKYKPGDPDGWKLMRLGDLDLTHNGKHCLYDPTAPFVSWWDLRKAVASGNILVVARERSDG